MSYALWGHLEMMNVTMMKTNTCDKGWVGTQKI